MTSIRRHPPLRRLIALSLVLALAAVTSCTYAFLAFRLHWPPYELFNTIYYRLTENDAVAAAHRWLTEDRGRSPGLWRPARKDLDDLQGAGEREALRRLASIGYGGGSTPAPPGASGVLLHDRDAAFEGYNLYCSGHAPEATLMDMDGRVVHRWSFAFAEAFPELGGRRRDDDFWRKVKLLDDGDLLALFEGRGLLRLDRHSNLLWARTNGSHHDVVVGADGRIFVLTREARMRSGPGGRVAVLEDFVSVLGPDGSELERSSLLEAVRGSDFAPLLDFAAEGGDLFHTNALQLLDGGLEMLSAAFRAGNLLVSFPHLNTVAVVDRDRNEVVWALAGMFRFQHDPVLLSGGRLLVFDNEGRAGRSRALEVDALTQQILWSFPGEGGEDVFSALCGAVQRLPNGNTLITESEAGRAIEVTPGKRVVWEFRSPHRVGDDGELVAVLFEVERLAGDVPLGWARE